MLERRRRSGWQLMMLGKERRGRRAGQAAAGVNGPATRRASLELCRVQPSLQSSGGCAAAGSMRPRRRRADHCCWPPPPSPPDRQRACSARDARYVLAVAAVQSTKLTRAAIRGSLPGWLLAVLSSVCGLRVRLPCCPTRRGAVLCCAVLRCAAPPYTRDWYRLLRSLVHTATVRYLLCPSNQRRAHNQDRQRHLHSIATPARSAAGHTCL